jgi:hypothetical protein
MIRTLTSRVHKASDRIVAAEALGNTVFGGQPFRVFRRQRSIQIAASIRNFHLAITYRLLH